MTKPIKPELRAHMDKLVAQARETGRNQWDVLNTAGLLYTEQRRRDERAEALRSAMEYLDSLTVPQLLGAAYMKASFTAGDMRRALMDKLYERSCEAKEGRA